ALASPPSGAPDPARLAHHAEAAQDSDAQLRYARLAGERASAVGAHREAAAQFQRALRVADSLPERQRADLLTLLAQEMLHVNRDGRIEDSRRALELAERFQDDETLLHTLNSVGSHELLRGIPGGKEKVLRSLDIAAELGMDEHVGRAYINLTYCLTQVREYDGFMELAARGIDFSLEHGLELWRMWIMTSLSLALLDQGDWSRAAEVADAVLHG